MHFITFPVASTNIFPLVNSKQGGQYVTEYNLKSREMVATNPNVKYAIGPSFIHSLDDFRVKVLEDSDIPEYSTDNKYAVGDYCRYNNIVYVCIVAITTPESFDPNHWAETPIVASHSVLQVNPGRAVVNGHYIETLSPMTIDLAAENAALIQNSQAALYGNLSIGIKTYFSEKTTMLGAMKAEGDGTAGSPKEMYIGVQLVIEQTSKFKTPNESPTDINGVIADLKLADFTYVNGEISPESIHMNPEATRYIPSDRITDFDNILDDKYVTSANLVDRMFYTFSGASGWCDSTDNLMVWDDDSEHRQTTEAPSVTQADFYTDIKGDVHFIIPHKQQDAEIYNDNNERLYYADRDILFPTANYATGSSGIVTKEYTDIVKGVANVLNTYKQFTGGKQIAYWNSLSMTTEGDKIIYSPAFPEDLSTFDVGDYILVREDNTVSSTTSTGAPPSTMYFVLPGGILSLNSHTMTTNKPSGMRLAPPEIWYSGDNEPVPTTEDPSTEELSEMFGIGSYQGTDNDYFELIYHNDTDDVETSYYYPVASTGPKVWSRPVLLTGGVPLASTSQLGGFYNISSSSEYIDAGYVYMDNTGHLRLMDYGLLRTGTLAYQLSDDYRVPANSTLGYIQDALDENVNARIAFKTNAGLSEYPEIINIYVTLPADSEGEINFYNIDSRFGTAVYLHFLADDSSANYSGITINIYDCEKIRIDSSIVNWITKPVINIFRSCLYYDASVIDYIRTCDFSNTRATLTDYPNFTGFEGLTLWYNQFSTSDPDLVVNGMEISQPNAAMASQDINFWNQSIRGDNHYSTALRSITLGHNGSVIACSIYVSNGSTQTTATNQHIIISGKYILPQGSNLNYPKSCIDHPLKVTGMFTTAYLDNTHSHWITTETSFSAKTGIFNAATGLGEGSIAFNSKTELLDTRYTNINEPIGCLEPGSYHIFYGGTTI